MKQELSELIKYNKESSIYSIITGLFFVSVSIFMFCIGKTVFCIAGIILGIVPVIFSIQKKRKYKERINKIKENGDLPALLTDFRDGKRFFNKEFAAGQNFLIGKNTEIILKYEDIANIFKMVNRAGYFYDYTTIYVVTKENEKKTLCYVKIWRNNKDELAQFFEYIKSRNPEIVLGYNEKQ